MLSIISRQTKFVFLFIFIFFLWSCKEKTHQKENIQHEHTHSLKLKYAQGFNLDYFDGYSVLTIKKSTQNGFSKPIKYALLKHNENLPHGVLVDDTIHIPLKKVVCVSTTFAIMIDHLGEINSLKGISGNYFYNKNIQNKIKEKDIELIGFNEQLDYEKILKIKPDAVIFYSLNAAGSQTAQKLKSLGIKVIYNSDYLESHPLGKAEWLLFMAALYGKENNYLTEIAQISANYQQIAQEKIKTRPTVMVNLPWKGSWYIPGGNTYLAQLIEDAGAEYIWKDAKEDVMALNIEAVFSRAVQADFWINPGIVKTRTELLNTDSRLENFRPAKTNQIFNNNLKINEFNGNDYWETGVLRPDLILKDLKAIFSHKFNQDSAFFYRRLP